MSVRPGRALLRGLPYGVLSLLDVRLALALVAAASLACLSDQALDRRRVSVATRGFGLMAAALAAALALLLGWAQGEYARAAWQADPAAGLRAIALLVERAHGGAGERSFGVALLVLTGASLVLPLLLDALDQRECLRAPLGRDGRRLLLPTASVVVLAGGFGLACSVETLAAGLFPPLPQRLLVGALLLLLSGIVAWTATCSYLVGDWADRALGRALRRRSGAPRRQSALGQDTSTAREAQG